MTKNPILDELRHVRESLLAEAGGSLDALVDHLQAEERRAHRPPWKPARAFRPVATVPPAAGGGNEHPAPQAG